MPAAGAWTAGEPNLPRYCAEILPCGAARRATAVLETQATGDVFSMNKYLNCGTAALILLATLPAQAASERSYLDLRLIGTSDGGEFSQPDGQGGTLDAEVDTGLGWGLRGAWVFAPRWHLYGEWSTSNTTLDITRLDAGGARLATEESDFDLDRIALGVGYHWPLDENWSLYGRLTWDLIEYGDFDRFELEGFGQVVIDDEDDSGLGATFGAQWVTGRWEFDAWGRYTSVGELVQDGAGVEFDNDFGGGARAVYNFTESLSLGADYELQDIDTWSVVFRYRF
jgi:hypothetical protein